MADLTTNFNFQKPLVNDATDEDLWGNETNENWDDLDGYLKTARDMVTLSKTANYTVATDDRNKLILGDATSASFTLTLPAAASAGSGFKLSAKKVAGGAHTLTLDPNGSETIDGAATYAISTDNDGVLIVSDGSNWRILTEKRSVAAATTSAAGIVELATPAEVISEEANLIPTAANLKYNPAVPKAILRFDGKTGGVATAHYAVNIASIMRNSLGNYTGILTDRMSDGDYAIDISCGVSTGAPNYVAVPTWSKANITDSTFTFSITGAAGSLVDCDCISVIIWGTLA